MSEGPLGSRVEPAPLYRKIFTGFRIALDIKKLLLAAAGIFLTFVGWWALSCLFYSADMPQWSDAQQNHVDWTQFKRMRTSWNLLHELAGPPDSTILVDAADVANSPEQFDELNAVMQGRKLFAVNVKDGTIVDGTAVYPFKLVSEEDAEKIKGVTTISFADLKIGDKDKMIALVGGIPIKIEKDFAKLQDLHQSVKGVDTLSPATRAIFEKERLALPRTKIAGRYRVSPWSENRGENPYLLVSNTLTGRQQPFERGGFLAWLLHDELPVLVEPLTKFISPVLHLFSAAAGTLRITTYLVLILVWNLVVWGYFGAAICRLAAVQIARNEKAPLGETLGFVNERYRHFVLAPAMPLVFLGILMLVLATGGFIAGWTFFLGDILAGLLWPLVIVAGLIMAVLLVGLLGWPLMYPTISVEGSDSFDALSRTYSYFYQKPWRYLGYGITALAYGAALTFFVGFMGSLLVHAGQLGFQGAYGLGSPNPASDRTQIFLFQHAPTSFGWRDLFLHNSPWAEPMPTVGADGVQHWQLKQAYSQEIPYTGTFASWLVGIWIGLLFLLVLGFSYSYFWTACTILYFLMRKSVDDIDLDEVHLEDDVAAPPMPSAPPAAAPKPGTIPLSVVEPPPAPAAVVAEPPKP